MRSGREGGGRKDRVTQRERRRGACEVVVQIKGDQRRGERESETTSQVANNESRERLVAHSEVRAASREGRGNGTKHHDLK